MNKTWLIAKMCIVSLIFVTSCWTTNVSDGIEEAKKQPTVSTQAQDDTLQSEPTQLTDSIPETWGSWSTVTGESTIQFTY